MDPWCHYATIGLGIAESIDLKDDASVDDLQTVIKRFDACSMVPDDILSKAYRNKLRVSHPDKNSDIHANEKKDLVLKAWGHLKHPTVKRNYDNGLKVMLKIRLQKQTFQELLLRNQHLTAAAKQKREQE